MALDFSWTSQVILGLCILYICQSEGKHLNITDCGSEGAEKLALDITPCDANEVQCVLKRGTLVKVTFSFIVKEYVSDVHIKLYLEEVGLDIPLPIPTDACSSVYSLRCPLKAGEKGVMIWKVKIPASAPTGEKRVKLKLVDPQGNVIVCFKVSGEIE